MITSELKTIIREEINIDLNNKDTLKCRDRDFVEARGIYYKLLRKYTNMTYLKIGKTVNKDHATVLYGSKVFKYWLEQDEELLNTYTKIKNRFTKYLGYEKLDRKLENNLEALRDNYLMLMKQYEELKRKYENNNLLD